MINSRTCALITYKARFKPAIGKAGKPTEDHLGAQHHLAVGGLPLRVPNLLVVGLAIAFSQPVSAAPLQPTSKWHVDFANSQCVASRDYGSEGSPLFLVFKKPPIGDVLQIAVVSNKFCGKPISWQVRLRSTTER